MANQQFTISNSAITDTSSFTIPGDNPGTDDSFRVDESGAGGGRQWYVHVQNGFNENIDAVVQGSHYSDESMDAPVDDGSSETVNAGSNGAFDGETGHSYIQLSVTPAAAPTSGELVVTFQSRDE